MSDGRVGEDGRPSGQVFDIVMWTERPMPESLMALLPPGVRVVGPWALPGTDPVRGIVDADAVVASARIRYDTTVLDRATRLVVIARTGAGVDNVAIDEATRRGIAVCNVPDGPTISTAEHAIMLLLAVAKRLKAAERSLRSGVWDIFNQTDAIELQGLTLGVIGLGKIGSRVAQMARAIGMEVLAWDPYLTDDQISAVGAVAAGTLDELLSLSHAVSLHAPLTDETRGFIDERRLALMPRGAILVNTARGGLVDERALVRALDTGRLSGAGLDVFAHEPLPLDSPLLGRDDVVVTPHVAAATVASRERLWRSAIDDALRCVRREAPRHIVNPSVLGPSGTVPPRTRGI